MKKLHKLFYLVLTTAVFFSFAINTYALEPKLGVSDSYRNSKYYSQLVGVDTSSGNQRQIFYDVACSQLDYHEGSSQSDLSGSSAGSGNFTEYGRALNANGTYWCAYFVSWCARQAGVDSMKTSGSAGPFSDTKYAWAEVANGNFKPQAGDIVTFKWSNDNYTYSHVGIVSSCTKNANGTFKLITIEGNTDDSVIKKTRNINANGTIVGTKHRIVNFGVPNFNNDGSVVNTGNKTDNKGVIGTTSKPDVSVSGHDVTVYWNYTGNASSIDVYLVQAPWGTEDIKYEANVSPKGKNYTFGNVADGEYCAFTVARPNADSVQSEWTSLKVSSTPPPNLGSGQTTPPVVSVNGNSVTVSWDYDGSPESFDIYLVQEPWNWADIKYNGSVGGNNRSYTFNNVANGKYCAFTIVRPNIKDVQSGWTELEVAANVSTTHIHSGEYQWPELAHPHYQYYKCNECGELYTDGSTTQLDNCSECNANRVPKIAISGDNAPSSQRYGANFGIRGIVSTDCGVINKVYGVILNSNGNVVQSGTYYPNAASHDLRYSINNDLIFNRLGYGTYTYRVYVTAQNGSQTTEETVIDCTFTVS